LLTTLAVEGGWIIAPESNAGFHTRMTTERTLDMTAAVAYCFFFSIFYVGGFYLFPSGRNPQASRNDANTIKERFASVGLSSLITLVICNQLTFYYTTSTVRTAFAF
jgi:hypothetical protein